MYAALAEEDGGAEQRYVLDRLDALLRDAKPVPLLGRVRVDREAAYELLDQLRGATPRAGGPTPDRRRRQDLLVLVDRLDELLHDARRVPLTAEVLLDPAEVGRILADTREAIDDEIGETPHAALLGELEALVRRGRPDARTPHVRVDGEQVRALADRIRDDVIAEARRARDDGAAG